MMFPRRLIVAFLTVVLAASIAETQSAKVSVEAVGMTVSDMDRAVEFYSALTFQKVSDLEVFGDGFEHLEGVFGARMRIVRMKLGNEFLDLTQYLAPPGRPIPIDSCRHQSKPPLESKRSIFAIPTNTTWKLSIFHPAKAIRDGRKKRTSYFSVSITLPLEFRTRRRVSSFIVTCLDCAKQARARTSEPSRNILTKSLERICS